MKLAKRFGRVGFLLGFLPPVLFNTPYLATYDSYLVCPLCSHYIILFTPDRNLAYLELGVIIGLLFGLAFALAGFGVGYGISRLKQRA